LRAGHSRRKFHDIHAIHVSPITTEAIARIDIPELRRRIEEPRLIELQ